MLCQEILIAALLATPSLALNIVDDWSTVNQLDIFKTLDTCATQCVETVNDKVWDVKQGRFCQNIDCVCSGASRGDNFNHALLNVTSCVRQACNGREDIVAESASVFSNICLGWAAQKQIPPPKRSEDNTTLIIRPPMEPQLTPCANFVLTGCLTDQNTRKISADCRPAIEADGWEQWRGIAGHLGCSDPICLCKQGDQFDRTVITAYLAAIRYCATIPSTKALPNPELDNLIKAVALMCASCYYTPSNYTVTINGEDADDVERKQDRQWMWSMVIQGVGILVAVVVAIVVPCVTGRIHSLRRGQYKQQQQASGAAQASLALPASKMSSGGRVDKMKAAIVQVTSIGKPVTA